MALEQMDLVFLGLQYELCIEMISEIGQSGRTAIILVYNFTIIPLEHFTRSILISR